jgi:hypothetical protein
MRQPFRIDPEAFYDEGLLRETLGLSGYFLREPIVSGSLKSCLLGHKRFFKGSWILAWLDSEGDRTKASQEDIWARHLAMLQHEEGGENGHDK